jgi:DNA-binding NarL/FixJ family response regulator
VRRGYTVLLRGEPDLAVCGEAGTALAALEGIRGSRPDAVLADLLLPGTRGLEFIQQLHSEHPDLPVLVCSTCDETAYAERALSAGARGYVMKSEVDTMVLDALRRVLRGGIYVSSRIGDQVLRHLAGWRVTDSLDPISRLSGREFEVFSQIGRGLTSREIAENLHISIKTVESYRATIKLKLDVSRNAELVRRAVQWVETTV